MTRGAIHIRKGSTPPGTILRTLVILMAFLVLSTSFMNLSLEASPEIAVKMSLPGELPRFSGAKPLVLAGIWFDITISAGMVYNNLTVSLFSDLNTTKNTIEKDNYRFSCIKGTFRDDLYDYWLDPSNSSSSAGSYSFRVAVNDTSTKGPWTAQFRGEGTIVHQTFFELQASSVEFSLSSPNLIIKVEPLTAGRYYPTGANSFRTTNSGNLPLGLSLTFTKLGDWLNATNITTLQGGKEMRHHLYIDAPSWDPGITNLTGSVIAIPLFRGPKPVMGLEPAYSLSFFVQVQVGRSDLVLEDSGAFALQYPAILTGNVTKTLHYDIYLTGMKTVVIAFDTENCKILGIIMDGKKVPSSFTITLVKGTEVRLNLSIKPTVAGTTAVVAYSIRTEDGNTNRTYHTDIEVLSAPTPPPKPVNNSPNLVYVGIFFLAVLVVGLVAGYMIYEKSRRRKALRHRKEKSRKPKGRSNKR